MRGAGYTSVFSFASGGSYSVNSLISNDSGCCLLNWHSGTGIAGIDLFHCDCTVSQAGCKGPLLSDVRIEETWKLKARNVRIRLMWFMVMWVTRSQHVATKYLSICAGQLQMFLHCTGEWMRLTKEETTYHTTRVQKDDNGHMTSFCSTSLSKCLLHSHGCSHQYDALTEPLNMLAVKFSVM